jgi:hypothetical protein
MKRFALALTVFGAAAGCSTTPTVTKQTTFMTRQEIGDAGLECRQMTAVDTNIPRTICAGEKTWTAYERKTRRATEELLDAGRQLPNAGRFNRN